MNYIRKRKLITYETINYADFKRDINEEEAKDLYRDYTEKLTIKKIAVLLLIGALIYYAKSQQIFK